MSEDGRRSLKRRVESDDESANECEQVQSKVIKIAPESRNEEHTGHSEEENDEIGQGKRTIDDAIKTLDRLQYELNMNNILLESPEASDHDTPPESEDDEHQSEEMLSQAHALGYAACIRETFRFLDSCGINKNDPIYKQLKSRFVGLSN